MTTKVDLEIKYLDLILCYYEVYGIDENLKMLISNFALVMLTHSIKEDKELLSILQEFTIKNQESTIKNHGTQDSPR